MSLTARNLGLHVTAAHWPTIRERERRREEGGGIEGRRGGNNILATGWNKVIDLANIFSISYSLMKGSVIHYVHSVVQ